MGDVIGKDRETHQILDTYIGKQYFTVTLTKDPRGDTAVVAWDYDASDAPMTNRSILRVLSGPNRGFSDMHIEGPRGGEYITDKAKMPTNSFIEAFFRMCEKYSRKLDEEKIREGMSWLEQTVQKE
jgi:hypothetical protein